MATREENIKKIKDQLHDELEKMSDEELDRVTGGTAYEAAGDSRFLNDLGLCDRFGPAKAFFYPETVKNAVSAGWKQVGVHVITETDFSFGNTYYIDEKLDKQITRQQAFDIACEKFGKKLQDMPGDYEF